MHTREKHAIALAVGGLLLAAWALLSRPATADSAHDSPSHVAWSDLGSASILAVGNPPTPSANRPGPDSAHTTFVIHQPPSPELMRVLADLQAAGQVSAIDASSASDRIFVLGEANAALALSQAPDVASITPAGAFPSQKPLANQPSRASTPQSATTFHLALHPDLAPAARDRLLAHLRTIGQVDDQGLSLRLNAPAAAGDDLARLPGVLWVSDEPPQIPTGINANGYITGVVTADDGGAPMAYTLVCAYQASPYVGQCTYTDASGVYSLSLPAGAYQVTFNSNDYHISEYFDDVPLNQPENSTPVPVTDDTVTPHVSAGLAPGAQIIGYVSDQETNNPLPSITIDVDSPGEYYYYSWGNTNASGVYTSTPGLPPGLYRVYFSDYSGAYASEYYTNVYHPGLATLIEITSTHRTGIDAALSRAAVITGTVTGPDPLENIYVTACYADEYTCPDATSTNVSGTYRLAGLAPIAYKLSFQDFSGEYLSEWHQDKPNWDVADPITLTSGTTSTIDAQLARAAVISGTVTAEDSGDPLNNISVFAYHADIGNSAGSDSTDASGAYRIGGLAAGSYKLFFRDYGGDYLQEYYDDKPDLASADPISVSAGALVIIDAQLTPAGAISGTVTGEDGGVPLDNIDVSAYDAATNSYVGSDSSDVSGTYHIGGLATGDYKVRFTDYAGRYIEEYYDDRPDLASADPVSVAAGATTVADAQLALAGHIVGTVTAQDSGSPLLNAYVNVYDAVTHNYKGFTYTDASGAYHIGGLRTGDYKLQFDDWGSDYLQEYYQDKMDLISADPISVTAGTTTTIDAELAPGGRVTGRVIDADAGTGLAGVYVGATRLDANTPPGWATTNANGYYSTTALYSGVYYVSFSAPRPYYSEYYDNFRWGDDFSLVTVTAPLTTTHIDAELRTGHLISGTVTGSGPLPSVSVNVYRGADSYGSYYAYTDNAGGYQVGPVAPGYYRVQFRSFELHASQWHSGSADYAGATVLELPGDTLHVDADLSYGSRVTGTVTDQGGQPIQSVWVYVYPAGSTEQAASGSTNANGQYATNPGLNPGAYQVRFSAPEGYTSEWYDDAPAQIDAIPITVTAGVTTTHVDAQLASYDWGTITGTVTAADTGLPLSAWVYAYNAQGWQIKSAYTFDGSYVLRSLPPGTYRLQFSSAPEPYVNRYYHDKADLNGADPVTVTAGVTTTHVDQALPRGGTITGTVTHNGGGLPGVYVYAQRVSGGSFARSTYTGLDGAYRLTGLDSGSYQVQFDPPSPYVHEWYDDAFLQKGAQSVSVTLGSTTAHVDAALEMGGIITGRVTAADTGDPLPGAYVSIYTSTSYVDVGNSYADMDGHYQTPGLPADDYQVYFGWGPWSLYRAEWYDDARSQSAAMTVTVPALGTVPDVDAALERGGSLSGWTYDAATGFPLTDVYAATYSADPLSYQNYAYSNKWGFYQVYRLASGPYKQYFSKNGYLSQWYDDAPNSDAATTVTVTAPDDTPNVNAYLGQFRYVYLPVVLREQP